VVGVVDAEALALPPHALVMKAKGSAATAARTKAAGRTCIVQASDKSRALSTG
jgi:hypothetical protein